MWRNQSAKNLKCVFPVSCLLQVWRTWSSSLTWRRSFISHTLSWPSRCLVSLTHTHTSYNCCHTQGRQKNTVLNSCGGETLKISLLRTVGRGGGGGRGGRGQVKECSSPLVAARLWWWPAGAASHQLSSSTSESKHSQRHNAHPAHPRQERSANLVYFSLLCINYNWFKQRTITENVHVGYILLKYWLNATMVSKSYEKIFQIIWNKVGICFSPSHASYKKSFRVTFLY